MNNTNKSVWITIGIIVAVLLIAVIATRLSGPAAPAPQSTTLSTPTSTITETVSSTSTSSSTTVTVTTKTTTKGTVAIPAGPSRPTISFLTPAVGTIWNIGSSNLISWNATSGVTGQIYLIDAKTGKFVGTILDSVGPVQTSYSWNTRDIFLSRTNPLKKDVAPGTYEIVMSFDQNHIATTTSAAFVVTN